MVQALKKRVRVEAGGVVSIQDASLPEGAEAEVIVLVGEALGDEPCPLPLTDIIGSGKGLFATPDEVDQYIRDIRDEWD